MEDLYKFIHSIIIGLTIPFIIFFFKTFFSLLSFKIKVWFMMKLSWIPSFSKSLNGDWTLEWHLNLQNSYTKKYSKINSFEVVIYHFFRYVAFSYSDKGHTYRFLGLIENDYFLSGKWYYYKKGGYFGFFQFFIDREFESMSGKWIGFNSNNQINSDTIKLSRKPDTSNN